MIEYEAGTQTAVRRTPRVAANPIPYWARDGKVDKSKEVFDQAFADFAAIGFTAVKADIPDGMTRRRLHHLDQQLRTQPSPQPVQLTRSTKPSTSPTKSNAPNASPPTKPPSASTAP